MESGRLYQNNENIALLLLEIAQNLSEKEEEDHIFGECLIQDKSINIRYKVELWRPKNKY